MKPRNIPGLRPVLLIDTNILLLLIGYRCSKLDRMGPQGRARLLNEIRGTIERYRSDSMSCGYSSSTRRNGS